MSTFCVSQNGTQVITLLNSLALFLHANRDFFYAYLCIGPKIVHKAHLLTSRWFQVWRKQYSRANREVWWSLVPFVKTENNNSIICIKTKLFLPFSLHAQQWVDQLEILEKDRSPYRFSQRRIVRLTKVTRILPSHWYLLTSPSIYQMKHLWTGLKNISSERKCNRLYAK